MEILRHFKKNLNYKDLHTQILSVAFCLLIGLVHIYYFFTNEKNIDIIQISCQFILIIIILVWLLGAPAFYYIIINLEKLFKNKQYKKVYGNFLDLVHQFNYKKWSIKRSILELFYTFLWFYLFIYFIIQLFHFGFIPFNLIGIITIILYIIAVSLNYFSCHMSFVFAFFLCQVTEIKELNYNKRLPSATWGLQLLKLNNTNCLITFFAVALLYTLFFIVIIFFPQRTEEMIILIKNEKYKYYGMFVVFVLTSFLFLILFLIPNIFLHRMFIRWKNNSLHYFEKKLNRLEHIKDVEDKRDCIIARIKEISNDKIRKNYIDIVIAVTTIALNLVSIATFILNYF